MVAYAARIGASFYCIESKDHEALQLPGTSRSGGSSSATRFLKLPLLSYFLRKYSRVLYLDDDVIVGPATPDLFASVPCDAVGATIEHHKPPAWHAMHWRSACELYSMPGRACEPKHWRLWNSGVFLLSRAQHAPMLERGWKRDASRLACRVLCDQVRH